MRRVVVAFASLVALAASPTAAAGVGRTVPCGEVIDATPFPYVGGVGPERRYRTVLGAVSLPPATLRQIVVSGDAKWPYWRKQGLVVRAGAQAVTISVPPRWRDRVAIAW